MKRAVLILKNISDKADKITRVVAIPVTIFFLSIVFFGVATRFIFKMPIIASEEFSRIGFVWACFLGAAICIKAECNIKIEALFDKFSIKLKKVISLAISVVSWAFYIFLFYYGLEITLHVLPTEFPASGMSQAWLYSALPITAVVMIIHGFYFVVRDSLRLAEREVDGQWLQL